MKKSLIALAVLGLIGSGAALAQVNTLPVVPTIGTSDLIQIVPGGQPTPQSQFASAAAIAGVPGYVKVVPLTAFSLTFGNTQTYLLLKPAGTLATGTITTAPNPSDGQRMCIRSTQTQTALTLTANTGQTITSAVTALTANTPVCYTFSKADATWDPS